MLDACNPGKLYGHVAVTTEHYILVFGGILGCDYAPLNDIWTYNLYTEQWQKHVAQGETDSAACFMACAAAIGSNVYVFGGYWFRRGERSTNGPSNALWKLIVGSQGSFAWSEIVTTEKAPSPSPRFDHKGWEYAAKLWIFGGHGSSPVDYINEHGDYEDGCNNQLLCFSPSSEEWTNPQCYGMVPEPRRGHAVTINQDNVWLFGGRTGYSRNLDDLFALNMHSLTWTLIQTNLMRPHGREACTLSIMLDDNLLLHGGCDSTYKWLSDTWMMDLTSSTWRRCRHFSDQPRINHTATRGINKTVVIAGGFSLQKIYQTTFHVMLEPKPLQQLAMKTIFKYQHALPWEFLPPKLTALLGTFDRRLDA